MDLTTAVRSDVLPSIGSLIIPGANAATPWVALAWGEPHNLKRFVDLNEGISTVAGALVVIGSGLFVESIGTFFESHVVDRWHKNHDEIQALWRDYLRISWRREPIGQRYLRRVLNTFKFELNLLVSIILMFPGVMILNRYSVWSTHATFWSVLIIVASGAYLAYAVYEDSDLLHRLRRELIVAARAQDALPTSRAVME